MINFLICIFFFNDTATTEIYTLSLHDALPIYKVLVDALQGLCGSVCGASEGSEGGQWAGCFHRHGPVHQREIGRDTSELQSPDHLVCRLLLEKKKKILQKKSYILEGKHMMKH